MSRAARNLALALALTLALAATLAAAASASPTTTTTTTATSQKHLASLERVWNCRDAAWGATGALATGRLLRCGNPSRATADDAARLRDAFGGDARSLVDLRSHEEVEADASAERLVHAAAASVVHVPLGDRVTIGRALAARASARSLLAFAYRRFVLLDQDGARGEMVRYMGGLAGLNRLMLEHEGAQLAAALKAVATLAPPVLLYCTAGKDRTGLVTALALAVAGVPRPAVVAEYALSHEHRNHILARAMQSVLPTAAEALEWASAPPRVMEDTLDVLDREYGGLDAYLDSVGFGAGWRARLRARLRGEAGDPFARFL